MTFHPRSVEFQHTILYGSSIFVFAWSALGDFATMGEDLGDGKVQDYKFLGQLQSFDEKKQCGMITCEETRQLWNQDVYIHKSVMDTARIGMQDYVRFGVHLNTRGQPQASLPVYKVGDDGQPIGVKDGENVIAAEEMVAMDPAFLQELGDAIAGRSNTQNDKKAQQKGKKGDDKGGKGGYGKADPWAKGGGKGGYGGDPYGGGKGGYGGDPYGGYGHDPWAGDPYGGKGGGKKGGGIDLFVGGVPKDATSRELHQIFRQYAGFMSLRMVEKAQVLVFVTFETPAQAQFVAEALSGYVFDQESGDQACITVQISKGKGKKLLS